MTTYIIRVGEGGVLPYCSHHLLRQVTTVELGYPLSCNSIQYGCQIKTSGKQSREGHLVVGEEQRPKCIRDVLLLDFSQSFS